MTDLLSLVGVFVAGIICASHGWVTIRRRDPEVTE